MPQKRETWHLKFRVVIESTVLAEKQDGSLWARRRLWRRPTQHGLRRGDREFPVYSGRGVLREPPRVSGHGRRPVRVTGRDSGVPGAVSGQPPVGDQPHGQHAGAPRGPRRRGGAGCRISPCPSRDRVVAGNGRSGGGAGRWTARGYLRRLLRRCPRGIGGCAGRRASRRTRVGRGSERRGGLPFQERREPRGRSTRPSYPATIAHQVSAGAPRLTPSA